MNKKIALLTVICILLSYNIIFSDSSVVKTEITPNISINEPFVNSNASVQNVKELSEEKVTNIITEIKKRFNIDDKDSIFKYSVNYESGINIYNFSWENDTKSTYIKYGEDDNVYWYNKYNNKNHSPLNEIKIKSIPKYSNIQAKQIAQAFIIKALPNKYNEFKLIDSTGNINSNMYNFEFIYFKNNIKVEGINAVIMIDSITGEVSNFTTSLNDSILYDSPNSIIKLEEAKKSYKDKLGLKLIYKAQYDYEKNVFNNIKILYVPKYGNEYAIDAKTGKIINIYKDIYNTDNSNVAKESATNDVPNLQLTELEIEEIQLKSKLSSLSQAKTKINEYKLELLEKDMSFISADLYESKINTESGYKWSLNYASPGDKNTLNIQLDAGSLQLLGFSSYKSSTGSNKISSIDIKNAKIEAAKIIKKYSQVLEQNLNLDEAYLNDQLENNNQYVNLRYERKENSIEFPENNISIVYDVLNNKISSYNKNWYNIKLPQPEVIKSPDLIYDKIFKENQIQLKYRVIYQSSSKINAKLIYEVNQDNYKMPLIFDARSGQRIVVENELDKTIQEYKDLSKSKYQEEISSLMILGIGFKGGELQPEKNINQDEFLYLISQTFDEYTPIPFYDIKLLSQSQKNILQQQLNARGILDKDEKIQSRSISNEEALKYLVRALGYEKLAQHTEIFKLNIADFKDVSQKYYGYVAIGDAMDIIIKDKENKLLPLNSTKRDQALKMIYNYLK